MEGGPTNSEYSAIVGDVTDKLRAQLSSFYRKKRQDYADILQKVVKLYSDDILFEDEAKIVVHSLMETSVIVS